MAHTSRPVSPSALLVTVEEAARRLGIGRSLAYELMGSGELPSVRIGRCRRISVEALSRFVDSIVEEGSAETGAGRRHLSAGRHANEFSSAVRPPKMRPQSRRYLCGARESMPCCRVRSGTSGVAIGCDSLGPARGGMGAPSVT